MRDTTIFDLIAQEEKRQINGIELIASENFASPQVMEAQGSESMIVRSGGDTSHAYVVKDGEQTVGTLDMTELVRALVPRVASEAGARQS